jgi:hypothetical protein
MSTSTSTSWADAVVYNPNKTEETEETEETVKTEETEETVKTEETEETEETVKTEETEETVKTVETEEDKIIECCDCNTEFLFDAGTQKFFSEKNLLPPKRCYYCKESKNTKHSSPEDPYVYFCKMCKVKHEMPAYEVAYFKKNDFTMRTKCKKCKQLKNKNNK